MRRLIHCRRDPRDHGCPLRLRDAVRRRAGVQLRALTELRPSVLARLKPGSWPIARPKVLPARRVLEVSVRGPWSPTRKDGRGSCSIARAGLDSDEACLQLRVPAVLVRSKPKLHAVAPGDLHDVARPLEAVRAQARNRCSMAWASPGRAAAPASRRRAALRELPAPRGRGPRALFLSPDALARGGERRSLPQASVLIDVAGQVRRLLAHLQDLLARDLLDHFARAPVDRLVDEATGRLVVLDHQPRRSAGSGARPARLPRRSALREAVARRRPSSLARQALTGVDDLESCLNTRGSYGDRSARARKRRAGLPARRLTRRERYRKRLSSAALDWLAIDSAWMPSCCLVCRAVS